MARQTSVKITPKDAMQLYQKLGNVINGDDFHELSIVELRMNETEDDGGLWRDVDITTPDCEE